MYPCLMRLRLLLILLAALLLWTGCDDTPSEPNVDGNLLVTTHLADGSPISMHLVVSRFPDSGYVREFTTNETGIAGITLPPGAYQLQWGELYWTSAGLRRDPQVGETVLTVPEIGYFHAEIRFGGLFLRAVDSETGQVVECERRRCIVELTRPDGGHISASSDCSEGLFYNRLVPGPYFARTDLGASTEYGNTWYTRAGQPYSPDTIWIEPGPTNAVDLILERSGYLQGEVRLPVLPGGPLPVLTAVPDVDPRFAIESRGSVTGRDHFSVSRLSSGRYFLRISLRGHEGWCANGRMVPHNPQGFTVQSGRATGGLDLPISGFVFDAFGPTGGPARVAEFWILTEGWPDTAVVSETSLLVPPGRHKVRAVTDFDSKFLPIWWPEASDFKDAEWISAEPGEAKTLEFPFEVGASITGRVFGPSGEPLIATGVVIEGYDKDGNIAARAPVHSEFGDFFLFGLPRGGVTILARPSRLQEGYADTWFPGTTDPGAAEVIPAEPPERIEGIDVYLQLP